MLESKSLQRASQMPSQVKHELFKSKTSYKLTMNATKQKKEMIITNDTSRERKSVVSCKHAASSKVIVGIFQLWVQISLSEESFSR